MLNYVGELHHYRNKMNYLEHRPPSLVSVTTLRLYSNHFTLPINLVSKNKNFNLLDIKLYQSLSVKMLTPPTTKFPIAKYWNESSDYMKNHSC